MKHQLKQRLSAKDAHYADNLVSGAKMLELFGDVATEILIRHDGDEGLFRAYESVDFLAPLKAGDFVEVTGELVHVGRTSRRFKFTLHKYIEATPTQENPHHAKVLVSPVLCVQAVGTCVVLKK